MGKDQFIIVKGRAYPHLVQGENVTRMVDVDHRDRERFYHHPAIQLSTKEMEAIDYGQGAPLCYEHRRHDVVGVVHKSYQEEDGSLTIWGKIPLNVRGRQIAEEIRRGEITGFSVGYGVDLAFSRARRVTGKEFREISLVKQPFFDDCKLTLNVTMSKTPSTDAQGGGGGTFLKKQMIRVKCSLTHSLFQ